MPVALAPVRSSPPNGLVTHAIAMTGLMAMVCIAAKGVSLNKYKILILKWENPSRLAGPAENHGHEGQSEPETADEDNALTKGNITVFSNTLKSIH